MTIEDHDDDDMNESAAEAARVLRAGVAVRPEWRSGLLARIEADVSDARSPRVWRIRPAIAMAAGLLLLVLGAAGGRLWSTTSGSARPIAAVPEASAVRFVFVAPGAKRVSVVGDFNQWNPTSIPLRRLSDGTWVADVPLAPGRYAYAFVVDGKIEADPTAPRAVDDDFGVANSIVMVRGS